MRRFVTLSVLLLSSVPFGVSISGCNTGTTAPTFCNGGDSGMTTAQAATITLQPVVYGVSLNYAEIGQLQGPTTTDCKGSSVGIAGIHLRHHGHDHRGHSADNRKVVRGDVEPQLRRGNSRLHLLHSHQ